VQKVRTIVTDDIDGSAADTTIHFGLDGVEYAIDLNDAHARAFRANLQRYVEAARKESRRRPTRNGRGAAGNEPVSSQVREWARSQGMPVKERGRVPGELVAKYRAATTA
jgi:nucleoid-associated protein Lsr2